MFNKVQNSFADLCFTTYLSVLLCSFCNHLLLSCLSVSVWVSFSYLAGSAVLGAALVARQPPVGMRGGRAGWRRDNNVSLNLWSLMTINIRCDVQCIVFWLYFLHIQLNSTFYRYKQHQKSEDKCFLISSLFFHLSTAMTSRGFPSSCPHQIFLRRLFWDIHWIFKMFVKMK